MNPVPLSLELTIAIEARFAECAAPQLDAESVGEDLALCILLSRFTNRLRQSHWVCIRRRQALPGECIPSRGDVLVHGRTVLSLQCLKPITPDEGTTQNKQP